MKIYVDNAATTKMSQTAINAMLPYMQEFYGNSSSLHHAGQIAMEALTQARQTIAKCIGCEANEIIFTSGGTEADNQALLTAAKIGARTGKKHIISTAFEHHAVLHTLEKLESEGFEVTLLDVHEAGIVSPEDVANAIREDTCLVTIMYANNEIGTIQPIAEIGAICRSKNILFHSDAVQAVGHISINVQNDHLDMLSLSGHKFHGPKGIGALYVRKGIAVTKLFEGGAQEGGRRSGTENIPAIVAMAAALEEASANIGRNKQKLLAMRDTIINGLEKIPHAFLNGDQHQRLPGNVHFCFEGIEGESLLLLLDRKGIFASSGSACTSASLEPSHVLLAIGRPHDIAHGSLRISLCHENTAEEANIIIQAVSDVVEDLRNMSPVWRDLQEGRKEHVI